jgi:hypothetical protein
MWRGGLHANRVTCKRIQGQFMLGIMRITYFTFLHLLLIANNLSLFSYFSKMYDASGG